MGSHSPADPLNSTRRVLEEMFGHIYGTLGRKTTAARNRKCGLAEPLHYRINSWQLWEYLIVLETQKNGNEQRELKRGEKGPGNRQPGSGAVPWWGAEIKGAQRLIKWGHGPLSRHSRAKITDHGCRGCEKRPVTTRGGECSARRPATGVLGLPPQQTPRLRLLIRGQQPIISSQLDS